MHRCSPPDGTTLRSRHADPVLPPDPTSPLAAEVRDGVVHLRWDPVADAGFTRARVFREGWLRLREIGRASGGEFEDADVEPGETYRYVVVLEHSDGRRAPPPPPVV